MVPNNSPATAITISLPQTIRLDMSEVTSDNGAWYRTVIDARVNYVSLISETNSAYVSGIQPYLSDGTTEIDVFADYTYRVQCPVTSGAVVYFQILSNDGAPPNTIGTFALTPAPTTYTPTGAICIPDDTAGFWSLIYTLDGTLVRSAPIAAGENGDIDPNTGIIFAEDNTGGLYKATMYDRSYRPLATFEPGYAHTRFAITSDQLGFFYFSTGDTGIVTQVDETGTLTGRTWTITLGMGDALGYIAAHVGGGALYYSLQGVKAIKTWNLNTDSAGADFAPLVANYNIRDIFVLQDGAVAAGYTHTGAQPNASKVIVYEPNGTVRFTLVTGDGAPSNFDHLCRGLSADHWFLWMEDATSTHPQTATWSKRSSVNGSVIDSFTLDIFESGYAPAEGTTQRFGPSASCPFFALLAEPNAPPDIPGTTTFPIRRLRQSPTVSADGKRLKFTRFQLDIQAGVGTPTGQGVSPTLQVQTSDDNGNTWSSIRYMTLGEAGAYLTQAKLYQLGAAYNRVFRVICSDPVSFVVVNAWLDVEGLSS